MKNRSGFTLVELLLASSMLAILASTGYVVLSAGARSSQKARCVSTMAANGQRALMLMCRDIREAVEHQGTRLTSLDVQYEGMDADTIDFIAPLRRHGQEEPGATGRCEIGYYIDNDPGTEARWLVRREDSTIDDDVLEGGIVTLAGPYVSELNLEFYDGFEWVSGWNDQKQFPRAVRIGILVTDPAEIETPYYFETTVAIPTR
jgi:type II secretion system protein J